MDLRACQTALKETFIADQSQADNLSQLTSNARGADKATCIQTMGGPSAVTNFLKNVKNNTNAVGATESLNQGTNQQAHQVATVTTDPRWQISLGNNFNTYFNYARQGLLGIVIIILLFLLIKKISRLCYEFFNSKRMVYIKVLLPRGDGKIDREREKEIAKDMKEKIARMAQVYNNIHKLGQLNARDTIMRKIFNKPKVTLMYHYEKGVLHFIVGTYPEYKSIVESAIAAQFSRSSIETIDKPHIFEKKFHDIAPMEPEKVPYYHIQTYKNQPDDPINNILDAMGKISRYDTATVIMPIKPVGNQFNERAKKAVSKLFKREDVSGDPRWKYIVMPWKLISFLIHGPSGSMLKSNAPGAKSGDSYIRMVKSEEDALNTMGEEAGNAVFDSGVMLITNSDDEQRARDNLELMVSSYSVYNNEYANSLDNPEQTADIFGFIVKPLWKLAIKHNLVNFFYKKNVFSVNELASLFHFPDATYNRSPIIEWMKYKILPAPDNLPQFSNFNGRIMSGVVAESYKKGKLTEILKEYPGHRAVGTKTVEKETLVPLESVAEKERKNKEIVEKDGKQMVKMTATETISGYKLFNEGILLGVNIYRNRYEPVYMKRDDRTRHHYCVGKSGTGKSVYLSSLARQDVWNGDGVCLIDPHGDLAEELLEYIPKERAKDVIYFDAGNDQRPMGLNLYEINSLDEADRTVNDATEIFIKMFGPEIFGPRIQEYFKYGSLTIMEDFEDKPTILDVTRLYTDDAYRQYKVSKVTNPVVKNFWEKTYAAMGDREKAEIIPYFSSKFVSFNTNRLIRNIIGQTTSAFNFDDIMNNQKILIINLSKGKIGELNAQLLGMILVSKIYNGAMARQNIPKKERKDFYLYVDEFQNFVSGTFADILSEARKYRLCLIMAHQYIAQLEESSGNNIGEKQSKVKSAVFGNVGTMQTFKIGAPDAEFMEKEYAPVLSAEDIVGIANYKAYIKLNIDNTTSRPFSMNSIYAPDDYRNKKIAPILQEYSGKKFGRKREFVDAEIRARLGLGVDENKLKVEDDTTNTPKEKETTVNNTSETQTDSTVNKEIT